MGYDIGKVLGRVLLGLFCVWVFVIMFSVGFTAVHFIREWL